MIFKPKVKHKFVSFLTVKKAILFLSSLLLAPCFGFAQNKKNITDQDLVWMRYKGKKNLSEKVAVSLEIEERAYWIPWRQHQALTRGQVYKKLGKGWTASGGFTYFLQALPEIQNESDFENRTELRPHIGFTQKQQLNEKLQLSHRYWFEFRFREQANDGNIEYDNIRFRYKLGVSYSLTNKIDLKLFDEIHLNLGNEVVRNVFNQNRIGGGLKYQFIEKLSLEINYFNWFQQRSSGDEFFSRDIVRFTLHHKL